MDTNERALLLEVAKNTVQLFRDRDDMVVAVTAVLLDLYRIQFQNGAQTKADVLSRLQVQRDFLKNNEPQKRGVLFLSSLIETLQDDKLDAAKLLRLHPEGHA